MKIDGDLNGYGQLLVSAPELDAEFEVCGCCPTQACGTVLGREMYFRARHGDWSFDVADQNGQLPSDGGTGSDGFYREGKYAKDKMSLRYALKIIVCCLTEYTGA